VLLLVVQGFIVRRSLSSLKKVREERQEILEGSRSAFSDNVPQEILPLVEEANHLLELLSQRLERSRNALGNLAHALKGPLSVVMQYLSNPDNMKNKVQFGQAGKQVQRIQELMDRELRRARLVGKGVSSKRFDPHAELPDLVGLLMQVYASKEVSLTYSVEPDTPSFGDREDMHELLGNLLDNACKWSVSRVHCRIYGETESGIHIIVEDDGSGLSGDELDRLMSRGVRLDESVEGHGLGLSIVKDIVRLYSGEISFSRSASMGGLCVRVLIPCEAELVQH
jgi:signal transduction histidine kinase